MGRKRARTGKQIRLYLAGLIFIGLAGCALVRTFQERDEARESLLRGRRLFAQGDYEGSLRENQRALSLSSANHSPVDEAIFTMGLIYAHAENPKRDQKRALTLFRRVANEYPRGLFAEQAKVWIGVLQMNEKLTQMNEKLNQMIEKSKQVDIEIEEKKRSKER